MKKLCIAFILFVTLFSKLDAQIFYNIEKPHSYQKFGLTTIKELLALNYAVDGNGNCYIDKLSINMKDYLKIEKIDGKNIARIKFNVASHSLGEMTLRFKDVKLNNGAYCYVYTPDYQIVAGPVYQKSINDMLNIVKIPANELVLEIIFNSEQDYNLIFSSISFQSIDDFKPKSKNSLQEDLTNWDCDNYGIDGNSKYFNNLTTSYSDNSASYLGAWYDCELFNHSNLFSVNDKKLNAARASCIIMESPHNLINYWGAYSGTLMNFPESDCKGIIFTSYHHQFINQICALTVRENQGIINDEQRDILDHTIIRFNWHHKYGKPLHIAGCSQNDFALWRKTIDFDEVIDYCGVRGVAYATLYEDGDYAILRMLQTPFYKELHLGWSTQRAFDCTPNGDSLIMNHPEDFSILGRHASTPTYIYTNSRAKIFTYTDDGINYTHGIIQKVIAPGETPPKRSFFIGWSGSQVLYPDYIDSLQRIGIGIIKGTGGYDDTTYLRSVNYNFLFDLLYCYIIDTSLVFVPGSPKYSLYSRYLHQFENTELNVEDDFYWMPSKENKEKCPSILGGGTDPCTFDLKTKIDVVDKKDGTMEFSIRIGEIDSNAFQGNQNPKGIRIYNTTGDQQTFYFDSFADGIKINSVIKFTISQCDIFYYQMMGLTSLTIGIDYYDSQGNILNAFGCNKTYNFPFPNTLCEALSITKEKIGGMLFDTCCTYKIRIKFKGCDDYSNIVRIMLNTLTLNNLTDNIIVPVESISNLDVDYESGEISFILDSVCGPTSYKLIAPFGGSKNCESYSFNLDCTMPDLPCDCCDHFWVSLERVLSLPDTIQIPPSQPLVTAPNKFAFIIHNVADWGWGAVGDQYNLGYCNDCQFLSAIIYCPGSGPTSPPIYNETFAKSKLGYSGNNIGSFESFPNGVYCFYIDIVTNQGICHDTICTTLIDGSFNPSPCSFPTPIEIDNIDINNKLKSILKSKDIDYDKVHILNIYEKVLVEIESTDKIDISKLPKGTYNILYIKKDKIIQTQKLIIK
jgi:hypothetical protein